MLIRKSALALILLTAATVTAVTFLLSNSLIEAELEKLLIGQFKAQSKVDGVDLNPFNLQGTVGHIEVANAKKPMQNLFQTSKAEVDVSGWSLLRGNVVVDTLALNKLELDAPRTTSGALPVKSVATNPTTDGNTVPTSGSESTSVEKKHTEEKTDWAGMLDELPKIDFSQAAKQLDIPDLSKGIKLESVERIKQAKSDTQKDIQSLTDTLSNNDIEKRIADSRQQIDQLGQIKITDLKSAESALKQIKALDANIKAINQDYKGVKSQSDQLINQTKLQKKLVSTELQKDIDTVKQLAKISDINTKDIAAILFGQSALKNMQQVMGYIDLIKRYMPESRPEKEISRRSGRDIAFPVTVSYEPRLLVKSLAFDGSMGAKIFSGTLRNFSSNPIRYQKPVQLELKSQVDDSLWLVKADMTTNKDYLIHSIVMRADNIKQQSFNLADSKSASSPQKANLINSDVEIKLTLDKTRINGLIQVKADQLQFKFAQKAASGFDKQIQAAFDSFNDVSITANISGSVNKPGLKLQTNFDQKIAASLKQVVGKQIDRANRDIESYINTKIGQELNLSNQELAKYAKPAKDILAGNEKGIAEISRLRSEAEKRINNELNAQKRKVTDNAKKQAEDKLKKSLKSLKF